MNLTEIRAFLETLESFPTLTFDTLELVWKSCFSLAGFCAKQYRDKQIPAMEKMLLKQHIKFLVPVQQAIPYKYSIEKGRHICAEVMAERLFFMIANTSSAISPLNNFDCFQRGLTRYLWDAIRRQNMISRLPGLAREDFIKELRKLEYELAFLEYDSEDFFNWEKRYRELICQRRSLVHTLEKLSEDCSNEPSPVMSPWKLREVLTCCMTAKPQTQFSSIKPYYGGFLLKCRQHLLQKDLKTEAVTPIKDISTGYSSDRLEKLSGGHSK